VGKGLICSQQIYIIYNRRKLCCNIEEYIKFVMVFYEFRGKRCFNRPDNIPPQSLEVELSGQCARRMIAEAKQHLLVIGWVTKNLLSSFVVLWKAR
jgi:hypothetical protein